jgi:DNA polymerase-3 subunit beta
MKLTIPQNELQKGLGRIQSIVEKRSTMPILANVLIEAEKQSDGGTLSLAATDLEVGVRGTQPAAVKKAGSVTASAKKLFEIVRQLPDESVAIEVSSNAYLDIRCARAHFNLAGSAAEEYPSLPTYSPKKVTTVQAVLLGEMIEKTMYATCTDETRYNLNGVFLEQQSETGKLRMVATDGHRLAYIDRDLGQTLDDLLPGVIIPRKGLAELKRLIDEEDADEFELAFESNNAIARKGDVTLFMRLIEGEYPKYQQVVPKEISQSIIVNTDQILQALRRVVILSAERSHSVKFELKEGQLSLSSKNPDLGEAQEDLDVDYAGEELTIAFNARYLIDALGAIQSKEVRLGFQDPLSPARIVPTDDDDTLAVVMPMRA